MKEKGIIQGVLYWNEVVVKWQSVIKTVKDANMKTIDENEMQRKKRKKKKKKEPVKREL